MLGKTVARLAAGFRLRLDCSLVMVTLTDLSLSFMLCLSLASCLGFEGSGDSSNSSSSSDLALHEVCSVSRLEPLSSFLRASLDPWPSGCSNVPGRLVWVTSLSISTISSSESAWNEVRREGKNVYYRLLYTQAYNIINLLHDVRYAWLAINIAVVRQQKGEKFSRFKVVQ